MLDFSRKITLFAEEDFYEVANRRFEKIVALANDEDRSQLMQVNENELAEYFAGLVSFEPLSFDFDNVEVQDREEDIPAEHFPAFYRVTPGRRYSKQVIRYFVPFKGDSYLLGCRASTNIMASHVVRVGANSISFEFIDFEETGERVKAEAEQIFSYLKQQSANLNIDVEKFNAATKAKAMLAIQNRKHKIQQQIGVLSSLGVRVRRPEEIPSTFSIPVKRTRLSASPSQSVAGTGKIQRPHPTLDEGIYNAILKVIFDTGRVFERLPSTYADKDEQTLRDHLILQLEPHFEGSTTGETFNKSGKTDILIRHERSNLFVAECKFWGGQKQHYETIDQLLSYLTWRESKAAIVYFVPTKEIVAPLRAIEESTRNHKNFVKEHARENESWFRYDFHLPGDPARMIHVAVLCFHLPRS